MEEKNGSNTNYKQGFEIYYFNEKNLQIGCLFNGVYEHAHMIATTLLKKYFDYCVLISKENMELICSSDSIANQIDLTEHICDISHEISEYRGKNSKFLTFEEMPICDN